MPPGATFLSLILAYSFSVAANTFLISIIDEKTSVSEYVEGHGQAASLHTHHCATIIHLQVRNEHLNFKTSAILLVLIKANAYLAFFIFLDADGIA